jgi:hypothetical protein
MRQRDHRRPARFREGEPASRVWALGIRAACGLAWLLGLATVVLAVVGQVTPRRFVAEYMALGPLFGIPAALLGARILGRRRANRLGWILLAMGLAQAIAQASNAYAALSVDHHGGALPGTGLATWVYSFAWMPVVALGPFLLLLFPDGRLPGRRWRPVAWVGGAFLAAVVVATAVVAWPARGPALYRATTAGSGTASAAALLAAALFLVGDALLVVGAVALLMRLRRLRGAARQQTKWFAFGAVPWVVVDLTSGFFPPFAGGLGSLVALSGLLGAIAVAVFRYQLYDIDRLLNRTLVYGLLTAILGAGYAVLVLVLAELLGQDRSSLGVAGATLAAAALFQPLRRRIQQAVDRRFNRAHYDATRTVEAFAVRLRDQVELDTLSAELLAVADQTMEPTRLSLWMRPPVQRSLPSSS